jgi:GH18 family chitinase
MRTAFDVLGSQLSRRLCLTSAVAAGSATIEAAYDVPEIIKQLDFINVMAYDFKLWIDGSPESTLIRHHSPLYPKPG